MTYFTSDQHFGHFNIIRLSHRPFATADEMDEAMIAKWNAKVKAPRAPRLCFGITVWANKYAGLAEQPALFIYCSYNGTNVL